MASRFLTLAAQAAARSASRRSSPFPPSRSFSHAATATAAASDLPPLDFADPDRFSRYNSPIPVPADHTAALRLVPATRVTTLSNGLRVASQSNVSPNAPRTATIGVWIDAGTRFESDETNGTAHFLEHMIFKGTARRSQKQLELQVENAGGHLNAYTSREMTTYYAKVVEKDVPAAVDLLADILQNSSFNEQAVDRERDVILREMQEVEKQVDEVMFDHLHATAFQGSPLGRTILGSADNVKAIKRSDLQTYVKTHYSAPRMVVSAAGAVDHDSLVRLVESKFNALPPCTVTAAQLLAKEPSTFTGSEVRIRNDDMPLAHVAVAYRGASWTDADAVPLMVMQAMLGSWNKAAGGGKAIGSELAQKVAANSLAESYMAFNTSYADIGLFGVTAVAHPDSLEDLAWSIMHETTRLVYRVSTDDVVRAQNQLKSSMLLHQDGTTAVAEDIGRQLLTYGRRIPLAEMFARIDAVDAEAVKRVADRFLFDQDVVVAAIGPTQFLPDYNWLRRRTYWLRY